MKTTASKLTVSQDNSTFLNTCEQVYTRTWIPRYTFLFQQKTIYGIPVAEITGFFFLPLSLTSMGTKSTVLIQRHIKNFPWFNKTKGKKTHRGFEDSGQNKTELLKAKAQPHISNSCQGNQFCTHYFICEIRITNICRNQTNKKNPQNNQPKTKNQKKTPHTFFLPPFALLLHLLPVKPQVYTFCRLVSPKHTKMATPASNDRSTAEKLLPLPILPVTKLQMDATFFLVFSLSGGLSTSFNHTKSHSSYSRIKMIKILKISHDLRPAYCVSHERQNSTSQGHC